VSFHHSSIRRYPPEPIRRYDASVGFFDAPYESLLAISLERALHD